MKKNPTKSSSRQNLPKKTATKKVVASKGKKAGKSGAGDRKSSWDKALQDVFEKCIDALSEDVMNLNSKDRIAFIKAIAEHFDPGFKMKDQPPGSDIKQIEITILHECTDGSEIQD